VSPRHGRQLIKSPGR